MTGIWDAEILCSDRWQTTSGSFIDGFWHLLRRFWHRILPVGLCVSTLLKKTMNWRWAELHFALMLGLPRIPIGHEQGNSKFAKLAPTGKGCNSACGGRNGNHCQPALSIGLETFWNCKLFVLKRFFY